MTESPRGRTFSPRIFSISSMKRTRTNSADGQDSPRGGRNFDEDNGPLIKEGILEKKSGTVLKGWSKQQVRLYQEALMWSESKQWNPKEKQEIKLLTILSVNGPGEGKDKGKMFTVEVLGNAKHEFKGSTEAEAHSWATAVRDLMEDMKAEHIRAKYQYQSNPSVQPEEVAAEAETAKAPVQEATVPPLALPKGNEPALVGSVSRGSSPDKSGSSPAKSITPPKTPPKSEDSPKQRSRGNGSPAGLSPRSGSATPPGVATPTKPAESFQLQARSSITSIRSMGQWKSAATILEQPGTLLREGVLEKKSAKRLKGWQKMHFRLHEEGLMYSDGKKWEPRLLTKMIDITKVTHPGETRVIGGRKDVMTKKMLSIDIVIHGSRTTNEIIVLRASSEEEARGWSMSIADRLARMSEEQNPEAKQREVEIEAAAMKLEMEAKRRDEEEKMALKMPSQTSEVTFQEATQQKEAAEAAALRGLQEEERLRAGRTASELSDTQVVTAAQDVRKPSLEQKMEERKKLVDGDAEDLAQQGTVQASNPGDEFWKTFMDPSAQSSPVKSVQSSVPAPDEETRQALERRKSVEKLASEAGINQSDIQKHSQGDLAQMVVDSTLNEIQGKQAQMTSLPPGSREATEIAKEIGRLDERRRSADYIAQSPLPAEWGVAQIVPEEKVEEQTAADARRKTIESAAAMTVQFCSEKINALRSEVALLSVGDARYQTCQAEIEVLEKESRSAELILFAAQAGVANPESPMRSQAQLAVEIVSATQVQTNKVQSELKELPEGSSQKTLVAAQMAAIQNRRQTEAWRRVEELAYQELPDTTDTSVISQQKALLAKNYLSSQEERRQVEAWKAEIGKRDKSDLEAAAMRRERNQKFAKWTAEADAIVELQKKVAKKVLDQAQVARQEEVEAHEEFLRTVEEAQTLIGQFKAQSQARQEQWMQAAMEGSSGLLRWAQSLATSKPITLGTNQTVVKTATERNDGTFSFGPSQRVPGVAINKKDLATPNLNGSASGLPGVAEYRMDSPIEDKFAEPEELVLNGMNGSGPKPAPTGEETQEPSPAILAHTLIELTLGRISELQAMAETVDTPQRKNISEEIGFLQERASSLEPIAKTLKTPIAKTSEDITKDIAKLSAELESQNPDWERKQMLIDEISVLKQRQATLQKLRSEFMDVAQRRSSLRVPLSQGPMGKPPPLLC